MTGRTLCELSASGLRGVYVGRVESEGDGIDFEGNGIYLEGDVICLEGDWIDFLGLPIRLGKSSMPAGYLAG